MFRITLLTTATLFTALRVPAGKSDSKARGNQSNSVTMARDLPAEVMRRARAEVRFGPVYRKATLQPIGGVLSVLALFAAVSITFSAERSEPSAIAKPQNFTVTSVKPERGSAYPEETVRIHFTSAFDGAEDWALFLPGNASKGTVVYLHGSFSYADQIFTRKDLREFWLSRIRAGKHPLLSVNMRGTSYMNPAAAADLTALLDYCQVELGCGRFVLLGGSGGASSAMAYAVLHPGKVRGVVAMGMCDILARLEFARKSSEPVLQKLAKTVFAAYGGTPEEKPELYRARSVLAHTDRLTMPIILTMGENDPLIPVAETRKIAVAMKGRKNFTYYEVPKGNHDSALWVDVDLEALRIRTTSCE